MRGILAGALALIVLQVLVTNARATNALGGVATGAGKAVQWFLDPNTPAIPDRTQTASATSPSSSSSSSAPGSSYLPPYTGPSSVQPGES